MFKKDYRAFQCLKFDLYNVYFTFFTEGVAFIISWFFSCNKKFRYSHCTDTPFPPSRLYAKNMARVRGFQAFFRANTGRPPVSEKNMCPQKLVPSVQIEMSYVIFSSSGFMKHSSVKKFTSGPSFSTKPKSIFKAWCRVFFSSYPTIHYKNRRQYCLVLVLLPALGGGGL